MKFMKNQIIQSAGNSIGTGRVELRTSGATSALQIA